MPGLHESIKMSGLESSNVGMGPYACQDWSKEILKLEPGNVRIRA
jgi:hypothetical protein